MPGFSDFVFEAGLVARSIGDYFSGGALRLGVTGLSRSGKTVFITALIDNLIKGGRLPVLRAAAEGRVARVHLEPQPRLVRRCHPSVAYLRDVAIGAEVDRLTERFGERRSR